MGEVVRVKDGFARNFLLPQGKALRATKDNRSKFEGMKVQLEARNLELKKEAEGVAAKLNGKSFIVVRQASDVGQLFGSVSARDIATLLDRRRLHGRRATRSRCMRRSRRSACTRCRSRCIRKSRSTITINVARNADEAERQARGEDVTQRREETDEEAGRGRRPRRSSRSPKRQPTIRASGEDEKTD